MMDMTMTESRMSTIARWCILRTGGPRTIALAHSLTEAGIDAWTPKRTYKRVKPGKVRDDQGRRITVEMDAPILPTFVFAREIHLSLLARLANDPASAHPAFSVFRYGGRYPLVSDAEVIGLQEAEAEALEAIQAQRDAETREEAERIRIAALRTEQARMKARRMAEAERRKALRAERRDFRPGQGVKVDDEPALTGVTGVVVSSDGRTALVDFGGFLTMKIEAWRLAHDLVQAA